MTHVQIKDYILLMLGAPVLTIELDENQIEAAISTTELTLEAKIERAGYKLEEEKIKSYYTKLLQEGALWRTMMILARIRSKFKSPMPDGSALDGNELFVQAYNYKEQWDADCSRYWARAEDHPLFEKVLLKLITKGHKEEAVDIAKSIIAELRK